MERHYKELEDAKSRTIGDLYMKETATQGKREMKRGLMRSKESELQQAERELTSVNKQLSEAKSRREEAESRKDANIAGAIGFGIATMLTLGLAAPITLPGAAICTVNAVEASSDEDQAERDINRARNKISQCEGEISRYRGEIRQLDNEIPALSQQIHQLKSEREKIHAQRGEVSDTIKYLHDVLYFWKEFGQLTEHGTDRATFLQKLSEYLRLHNQHTARLAQQVQSCTSSWERVEKKLVKANEHIFFIDFTCQFCQSTFYDLPHLSYGKFCCIGCKVIR